MAPPQQSSGLVRVLSVFTLFVALVAPAAAAPTAEEKMNLVAEGFAAFGKGDIAGFVGMFSEDHTYIMEGGPELPWTGIFKGSDAVLRAVGVFTRFVNFTVHDMDLFASPSTGRVVAQYNLRGNALATGHPIEEPCFLRFDIGDDLRVRETMEACNALKEYRILIKNRTVEEALGIDECSVAAE